MDNGDSNENKELTSSSAEAMTSDITDIPKEIQTELTNEMQSVNKSDLQSEDHKVHNEMDSLNIDLQREDQGELLSDTVSSNTNDLQREDGELARETQSVDNVLQREEVGEMPSGVQSLADSPKREEAGAVPSGMQSININDLQRKDQKEALNGVLSPNTSYLQREDQEELPRETHVMDNDLQNKEAGEVLHRVKSLKVDLQGEDQDKLPSEVQSLNNIEEEPNQHHLKVGENLNDQTSEIRELGHEHPEEKTRSLEEIISEEKEVEPIFDGTEGPEVEATGSSSTHSDLDPEGQGYAWPDKAVAIKNFVREKSVVAVSSVIRRLSGKKDEDGQNTPESEEKNDSLISSSKDEQDLNPDSKPKEVFQKPVERSTWNPLSYIKIGRDADIENNNEQREVSSIENSFEPPPLKGRVILYTRLGCQDCREARIFLHQRRLKYVEINIDVYPSRKLELEKYTGSSAVPVVFFNELPVRGFSELNEMDESGKLKEKISDLIIEEPSDKAPVLPLSGEDDECCNGMVDELALIVRKMRESILIKDRFYRMRRFSNCFVGSEAVDFLSEDQYLERKEAIEFGKKLSSKHFFKHVLEENVFEDGNHLYRFLDHDPIVSSQCYNIPKGIIDARPKPIIDIASRLRFLSLAMFEAYASIDGKHVDYRSIHGNEEFARYLRVVEELQRVEMQDTPREEKLAFFVNLYNMMAIHAILMWGYPVGPLERRKMFGDFKYVIGGYTYSLSAIENGILRCNQRPPYNLIKPFGVRDPRNKIALPYPEPLIHFALVSGTRSGPALRCFSPSNIDKELMEAARNFMRNGGVIVDPEAKVASVSKILRWYSADFGKSEVEVLKHAANYLESAKSEELLELLANTQMKVVYQPYDWGVNC